MDAAPAIICLMCRNRAEILWRLTNGIKKESPKVSADGCDKNNRFKEERCQMEILMLVLLGVMFLVHRCSSNNPPDVQQSYWDVLETQQWYQKESHKVSADGCDDNNSFEEQSCQCEVWNISIIWAGIQLWTMSEWLSLLMAFVLLPCSHSIFDHTIRPIERCRYYQNYREIIAKHELCLPLRVTVVVSD